jgi:pimeloyl-ACP methyl ester carboxylesterase
MECKLDNITVNYEVRGEGYPLLLLHGATLDHRHMMTDFEPLFADRPGWLRIYPDLPGHGKTPAPAWIINQDHVFEVVLKFAERILSDQHFAVAGSSWGGVLARPLLQKKFDQISGVCYTVTPILFPNPDAPSSMPEALIQNPALVAKAASIDPRAGDVMKNQPVQISQVLEWWLDNSRPAKELLDQEFAARFWDTPNAAFTFNIDQLPQPFEGPTLVLMGRQDYRIPFNKNALAFIENYPRATVALLDRAGHLAMVHQRRLFNALVSEWFDRVEEKW